MLGRIGSIDTLEIKTVLETPPRLVLYSHRFNAETICQIDSAFDAKLRVALAEGDATFWLRSIRRDHVPFFGFWTRYRNYDATLRVKHGTSRRKFNVPCAKQSGESLLALLNLEWSAAA